MWHFSWNMHLSKHKIVVCESFLHQCYYAGIQRAKAEIYCKIAGIQPWIFHMKKLNFTGTNIFINLRLNTMWYIKTCIWSETHDFIVYNKALLNVAKHIQISHSHSDRLPVHLFKHSYKHTIISLALPTLVFLLAISWLPLLLILILHVMLTPVIQAHMFIWD